MKKENRSPEVIELAAFKERSGLSYHQIGAKMGVHPQTVFTWISGKNAPSFLARKQIRHFIYIEERRLKRSSQTDEEKGAQA